MSQPLVEMADIVRCAGQAFIEHSHRWINWQHRKVLLAIVRCRTAALGGHRDRCTGCGHTTMSSAASSSKDFATPFNGVNSSSTAAFYLWPSRAPSPHGCAYCSATTGSSTPSSPSADRNMRCAPSAPTPIASPSRTPDWSLSPMATLHFAGEIQPMATRNGS